MSYQIDILDSSRNYLATIKNTPALTKDGVFLEYSRKLSDFGTAKFRVGTQDPLFTSTGDILQPYINHVRIKRSGVTVWQGVIIDCPSRNKNYIEVVAYNYLYLLSKVPIRHDASVTAGDGKDNYRAFTSGSLSSAINTILTEAKADAGTVSAISGMTIGTIDNPNFPANYTTAAGAALSGAWAFSSNFSLQFDYRDILYVIQMLGQYGNCDFEMQDSLLFNFQTYIGNKQPQLVFRYGQYGNIEDYNSPLYGGRMSNYLVGIAADYGNQILHEYKQDDVSVNLRGRIFGVAAYSDVKNPNALRTKLTEELRFVSTPDAEVHFTLKPSAYPLGQWNLGDTVTVIISDHIININQARRIVGYDCKVFTTGREQMRLITNIPRDTQ